MTFASTPIAAPGNTPALEGQHEDAGAVLKLYYMAGDCSQAVHILLREAGVPFEIVSVDPHAQRTDTDEDYLAINPSGLVPALKLTGGVVLTELTAALQYVADRVPGVRLLPPIGDPRRYEALSWLAFIGAEIHHPFSMLFDHECTDPSATQAASLCQRLDLVEQILQARPFLLGSRFTAPDAYLFVVTGWLPFIGLKLERWPALRAFRRRAYARPAVQATLEAEGFPPA